MGYNQQLTIKKKGNYWLNILMVSKIYFINVNIFNRIIYWWDKWLLEHFLM
jgi:hypothetical protein